MVHTAQMGSTTKAQIPLETGLALATKHKLNQHKKHEMYMANAEILCLEPNATYIPLTCVALVSRWVTQILGLVSGVFVFLDTNMLVKVTQNCRFGGATQRKAPTPVVLCHSGI